MAAMEANVDPYRNEIYRFKDFLLSQWGELEYMFRFDYCRFADFYSGMYALAVCLVGVFFLLHILRICKMRRRSSLTFSFKDARGRAEIAVAVTSAMLAISVILASTQLGLAIGTCNDGRIFLRDHKERHDDIFLSPTFDPEVPMNQVTMDLVDAIVAEYYRLQGNLDRIPDIATVEVVILLLAISSARFAVWSSFGNFRKRFSSVIDWFYYAQLGFLIASTLTSTIGVTYIFHGALRNSFYWNYPESDWTLPFWICIAFDFLYVILNMVLAKKSSSAGRCSSLWTLTIFSSVLIATTIITGAIGNSVFALVAISAYALSVYFALTLAYLPGWRFWDRAWKDPNYVAKNTSEVELGTATSTSKTLEASEAELIAGDSEGTRVEHPPHICKNCNQPCTST